MSSDKTSHRKNSDGSYTKTSTHTRSDGSGSTKSVTTKGQRQVSSSFKTFGPKK